MSYKEKTNIRGSELWPEIASYYDEQWDVIQANHSNYRYMMQGGEMTEGTVPYLHGLQVGVIQPHIPESERWAKEPGGSIPHKPDCAYRTGGWKDRYLCHCHAGRLKG